MKSSTTQQTNARIVLAKHKLRALSWCSIGLLAGVLWACSSDDQKPMVPTAPGDTSVAGTGGVAGTAGTAGSGHTTDPGGGSGSGTTPQVCGDETCSSEETCATCATDCGRCPSGGTAYYVDLGRTDNGDGTLDNPWNNLASVNSHDFQTGDDVYLKCGTVSSGTEKLDVDWSGTADNQVVIGAYDQRAGVPVYGVSDAGMPVIEGTLGTYPSKWDSLIRIKHQSHVVVQDIETRNSQAGGIALLGSAHILVQNVHTQNTVSAGILVSTNEGIGTTDSIVDGCIVERASYQHSPGAAIEITAGFQDDTTKNITVRNTKVFHSYEGIGCYKTVRDVTIENNEVYDNRSFHMYVAGGSHHITWRNNIVYNSSEYLDWSSSDRKYMFAMNLEVHRTIAPRPYSHVVIDNNYIAGGKRGISIGNSSHEYLTPHDITITHNRIVDCDENIRIWPNYNGTNTLIAENISGIYESDGHHVLDQSSASIDWSDNAFNSDPGSAPLADGGEVRSSLFVKESGWRALTPGEVDASNFQLTDE